MKIKRWIESVVYRFLGCFYSKFQDPLFNFIETKIPRSFTGRSISDLGCGDGINTLRIKRIFKAKKILGYESNNYLLEKAKSKGLKAIKLDLNKEIPKGELATFIFSLHHLKNKEKVLGEAVKNFDYIFLCEPIRDLYHFLFDVGKPLKKQEWISLFDKVLKKYLPYRYKNFLIVFWRSDLKYAN